MVKQQCRRKDETMSDADILFLAGIIGAFVLFAASLAWADYRTRA